MVGTKIKIGVLGVVALFGLAAAIPSGLTSLSITGIALIGIIATLTMSVLK